MKKYINTVIYWLFPQSGQIACLRAKVKAQEELILTIKANRQTIINENIKLTAALDAIRQAAQGGEPKP